jgi:hypothetical protein
MINRNKKVKLILESFIYLKPDAMIEVTKGMNAKYHTKKSLSLLESKLAVMFYQSFFNTN